MRAGSAGKSSKYASPVMGSGESGPMDLGGAKRSRSPSAASPAAFWVISLVPPGEAQRSGFAGKRRSKGTSAVFATRRKRSRVDFATTSRHGQSHSPPAGGEIPLRKEPSSGPMRASGPTKKRSIIAPSSVTVSPCHLPPKGKAFKGSPLIRPLRGHLSLSPLSLRDIIPTPFGLRPFLPDRGNRPLDKGSRPPGGRLWRAFYPGL